jgi:hypothetical protein
MIALLDSGAAAALAARPLPVDALERFVEMVTHLEDVKVRPR